MRGVILSILWRTRVLWDLSSTVIGLTLSISDASPSPSVFDYPRYSIILNWWFILEVMCAYIDAHDTYHNSPQQCLYERSVCKFVCHGMWSDGLQFASFLQWGVTRFLFYAKLQHGIAKNCLHEECTELDPLLVDVLNTEVENQRYDAQLFISIWSNKRREWLWHIHRNQCQLSCSTSSKSEQSMFGAFVEVGDCGDQIFHHLLF